MSIVYCGAHYTDPNGTEFCCLIALGIPNTAITTSANSYSIKTNLAVTLGIMRFGVSSGCLKLDLILNFPKKGWVTHAFVRDNGEVMYNYKVGDKQEPLPNTDAAERNWINFWNDPKLAAIHYFKENFKKYKGIPLVVTGIDRLVKFAKEQRKRYNNNKPLKETPVTL